MPKIISERCELVKLLTRPPHYQKQTNAFKQY